VYCHEIWKFSILYRILYRNFLYPFRVKKYHVGFEFWKRVTWPPDLLLNCDRHAWLRCRHVASHRVFAFRSSRGMSRHCNAKSLFRDYVCGRFDGSARSGTKVWSREIIIFSAPQNEILPQINLKYITRDCRAAPHDRKDRDAFVIDRCSKFSIYVTNM